MKKIIDGLMYDTDVSTLIFLDESQNRRWFMTQNRNFFVLYGTGQIAPKDEAAVKAFLGENDVEKYIELFGAPQEA